jgi:hypothetical protein
VLIAKALAAKPSTPGGTVGRTEDIDRIPLVELGGPTSAAWREEALTRAHELQGMADWIQAESGDDARIRRLLDAVRRQIARAARTAANEDEQEPRATRHLWTRLKASSGGSSVERTLGGLDAAEADLLRLAPADYVCGQMPSLLAHVNRYLPKDDPRRKRLEPLVTKAENEPLSDAERSAVVATYHAANSQRRREILRLRSFRNVILLASGLLLLVAVGLGVLGSLRAHLIPLCFTPDDTNVVCPTHQNPLGDANLDDVIRETVSGWDVWLVELVGLVAAALAAAFALRGIRGTSTPYSLPVALAALKLPTGALTAVLGLLLMSGGFVPGLSALDTSAQIVSWAIVFGYSQQLLTRMVDQQAQSVLEDVGGRGAAGDRQTKRG